MGRFHRRNRFSFRGRQLLFLSTLIQDDVVQTLENTDLADPIYGSGVDGNIYLMGSSSGTSAITGSGTSYTLTRDVFCRNMTLNSSVHLHTNGYRLFVQGTLTMHSGSRIGYTTGFSTDGSIKQGGAANTSVTHSLGGSSATQTATDPTAGTGGTSYYQQPMQAVKGYSITASSTSPTFLRGGAGGSAGPGGGVVIVAARFITAAGSTSYISAPGTPGSGGGGGGVVLIVSSASALPSSISTSVAGGTGCSAGTATYMQVP